MKNKFEIALFDYVTGDKKHLFDITIDESELEGLKDDERLKYIYKVCFDYIMDNSESK